MPGYVKIWTTILADEKFLSLTGNQRSIYLQLLLICKDQSDDAQVRFKSYSQAAHAFGADDSTTTRALLKLHSLSLIELDKGVHNVLIITLPNYEYYQGLTVKGMHAEKNKRRKEKCQKKLKKDTRPEQTKPDQSKPNQEEYPFDEIIADLNSVTKREGRQKFRTGDNTKDSIRARFKDGYDKEDFKHVHRIMTAEWSGTEFEKHLNPDTLYRKSKFPKYAARTEQSIIENLSPAEVATAKAAVRLQKDKTCRKLIGNDSQKC